MTAQICVQIFVVSAQVPPVAHTDQTAPLRWAHLLLKPTAMLSGSVCSYFLIIFGGPSPPKTTTTTTTKRNLYLAQTYYHQQLFRGLGVVFESLKNLVPVIN